MLAMLDSMLLENRIPQESRLFLSRPSAALIRSFLETQSQLNFSYAAVGSTASKPPAGFSLDCSRVKLGDGEKVFDAAKAALRNWKPFELGWVEATPIDTPIEKDAMVAIVARSVVLWTLHACRIVYVVDEDGPICRYGFAYGTLPGHMEMGEERFLIEWDRARGEVCYDILAFSRPRHILARLAYPWTRYLQARFRRDSSDAMRRTITAQ